MATVNLPSTLTTIGESAFHNCHQLTAITIPNNVTTIGNSAFNGCSGLTTVALPNSVTTLGTSVFYGCSGLTTVTLPNSITAINLPKGLTTIGDYAFYGTQIINVTIPRTATTLGSNIFANCQQLRTATFQEGCTTVGVKMFEAEEFQDAYGWPEYRTNLREVNLPNSLTTIGAQAFSYCVNLPNITIPVNVTLIDNEAFKWCYNMQNVYCYPNPANLTWTGASNSFDGNQSTQCHVLPQYLDAYQTKFGYNAGTGNNDATGVRVVFVGDLNCSVFTTAGNWNEANNWSNNMVPSAGSDVIISANVTIPSGYTADAGNVAIMTGNTLTIADGGQLKHTNEVPGTCSAHLSSSTPH